jgi:hypothetical protein
MPGRTIPVLSLSEAPLPDAVQPSKSMVMAVDALAAMDANAVKVRAVALRLLTEHAENLPELLAVRTEASQEQTRLDLQPRTNADAALWAQALGVELETYEVDAATEGWRRMHARGDAEVDGVLVHIGSCESVSPAQLAARSTEAVSA